MSQASVSLVTCVCRLVRTPGGDFAAFRVGNDYAVFQLVLAHPADEAVVREALSREEEPAYEDDTAD